MAGRLRVRRTVAFQVAGIFDCDTVFVSVSVSVCIFVLVVALCATIFIYLAPFVPTCSSSLPSSPCYVQIHGQTQTWPRPVAERSLPATWHILNTFHALLNSVVVPRVPQGYLLLENMFTRVVHILIVCLADIFRHCKMYLCARACVCVSVCFVACLTFV